MDKDTQNTLPRLIERFMAGETTLAEEQRLYRIFAQTDDLGDYEKYRPMFAWYASSAPAQQAAGRTPRYWWLRIAAAVAVALAVGTAVFTGFRHNEERNELYAHLQGSYVRINGKSITDVSKIYDRLLSAEYTADSLESVMNKDYDDLNESIVREAIDGISDPEIAALLKAELQSQDI